MTETREDVIADIERGIEKINTLGDEVRRDIITTDRLSRLLFVLAGFMIGLVVGLAL